MSCDFTPIHIHTYTCVFEPCDKRFVPREQALSLRKLRTGALAISFTRYYE